MNILYELFIIVLISCLGEIFNYLIPLPIPGSIYGMIILFLLLCLGVIKINQVKKVSGFLLEILPLLFIPSAVGIISQLDTLKEIWLEVIIITIITTIVVMSTTGIVTQLVIKHKKRDD